MTRNGLPTLVIENKALYGRNVSSMPPAGFSLMATNDPFPIVRLSGSPQPMITIVAIGGMAVEAEQALNQLFDEDDIIGDLFMPTRLYPFDIAPLLPSIQKSGRLIIVEEGQGFAAIGAEVISQAVEALSGSGLIVERVAAMPCAIPAARPLEAECLPDVARVRAAAVRLVHAGRGRQS